MYQIDPFLDGLSRAMAGDPTPEPTLADIAAQKFAAAQSIQSQLDQAILDKRAIPYDQRNPRYMAQRQALAAKEEKLRAELDAAIKEYNTANNDRASAEIQSRFRREEAERQARRDLAEAQHAAIEEQTYYDALEPAFLQAGGTKAEFEAAKGGMWKAELKKRATAGLEQAERAARATGRYDHL